MKLAITKSDLSWVQQKGFIKDQQQVNDIWTSLSDRCHPPTTQDVIDAQNAKNQNDKTDDAISKLPAIKGNLKASNQVPNSVCIAYSRHNGSQVARTIQQQIIKLSSKSVPVTAELAVNPESKENINYEDVEKKVANSTALVVLLTSASLKSPEVVFAMTAAKYYYQHISQVILVHDAGSCFFPSYDEQPPHLTDFFSEKAVTFLKCYSSAGVKEILDKFYAEQTALTNAMQNRDQGAEAMFREWLDAAGSDNVISTEEFKNALRKINGISTSEVEDLAKQVDKNGDGSVDMSEFCDLIMNSTKIRQLLEQQTDSNDHHEEDVSTTLFLSHKRSTGQGIAGRLYEGLKNDYSIFLDSEAKFKIHDLKKIVQSTRVFLFILSGGIFQSRWCCEELKSAMANGKKIILVRELSFTLPSQIPPEWEDSLGVLLKQADSELIWMAEYNNSCIKELKKRIGPSDSSLKEATDFLKKYPEIQEKLNETGTLELRFHTTDVNFALLNLFEKQITSIRYNHAKPQKKEFRLLRNVKSLTVEHQGMSDVDVKYILRKLPQLQQLHIIGSSKLTDDGAHTIATSGLKLTGFTLSNCKNVTSDGLKHILSSPFNFAYLDLTESKLNDSHLPLIAKHTNLTHLSLGKTAINLTEIPQILAAAKNIEFLNIENRKTSLEGSIEDVFKQVTSKLTSIDIRGSIDVRGSIVVLLNQAPHLKQLRMEKVPNLGESFLELAKFGKTLEMLDIPNSFFLDDQITAKVLASLPALKYFNTDTNKPLPEVIQVISEQLPQLKHLGLSRSRITDDELIRVAEKCKELEYLDVTECTRLTDKGFKAIGNLTKLKVLKLNLTYITSDALQDIGSKLSHLEELHINAGRIDDNGLIGFFKHRPNLRILFVNDTYATNEKAIQALSKSCPDLEVLQAQDVQLNDNAVDYLVNGCQKLHSISIPKNRISSKGALALMSLPNIGYLDITNNGRIVKEDRQAVLAAAVNLDLEHSLDNAF